MRGNEEELKIIIDWPLICETLWPVTYVKALLRGAIIRQQLTNLYNDGPNTYYFVLLTAELCAVRKREPALRILRKVRSLSLKGYTVNRIFDSGWPNEVEVEVTAKRPWPIIKTFNQWLIEVLRPLKERSVE